MTSTNAWIYSAHRFVTTGLADWLSVLGFAITIVGFAITIIRVRRSTTAAERAAELTDELREDISRIDTVADCANAISILESIRLHQRMGEIALLPDKYMTLRKVLIQVKASNPVLNDVQRAKIQGAVTLLNGIEREVVKSLQPKAQPLNIVRLHKILGEQIDSLYELMVSVKKLIGG